MILLWIWFVGIIPVWYIQGTPLSLSASIQIIAEAEKERIRSYMAKTETVNDARDFAKKKKYIFNQQFYL